MDKFSGSLAGLRSPAGGEHHCDGARGVAARAAFEEVLTDTGGGGGLLRARLSLSGAVEWAAVPAEDVSSVQRRVVAQSQMSGMLRDGWRNAAYGNAIRAAVGAFVAAEKRRPVVLDVGCGTGLLSLMAAEAGAAAVIGCE